MKIFFRSLFCLLLMAAPVAAQAQLLTKPATPAAAPAPHDELDRDTPRGTIMGLVDSISKEDWPGASAYFDMSFLPKAQQRSKGAELARQMGTLLNAGGFILPNALVSDDPGGKVDDNLDPDVDKVGALRTGKQSDDLLLHLVRQPGGTSLWLVAPQTLRPIPAMIEEIQPPLVNGFLPQTLIDRKFWSVPVGHWLALFVTAAAAYLAMWLVTTVIRLIVHAAVRRTRLADRINVFDALELPVRMYLGVWVFIFASRYLGISALARQHFSSLVVIAGWLSLVLFIWRFIDIAADRTQQHMSRKGKLGMFSVISFIRRAAKFIFIAVAGIVILGTFGVDIRTFIAALGIGGIALALGAQKTVENFVGSLMLVFDQPVRLGDYCQIGTIAGTVEDIGMRSTRLRTNDRTIVTIPNGDFSSQKIENFSRRDRYLFNPVLQLRYDTAPDQVRWLLVKLRELLFAHPMVSNDPARVRFTKFDVNSMNLEFFAYIVAPAFDDFMEAQEDLLLRILDLIAEAGTALAFNTHLGYNAWRGDYPPEQPQAAAGQVRDWESKGELQIPKMDPTRIDAIRDTLRYPPPGSAAAKDNTG